MIVFLTFSTILIGILTSRVSTELTSRMCLTTPEEEIESLGELSNSKKTGLIMNDLKENKNLINDGLVMEKIVANAHKEYDIIEWKDIMTDHKWIDGVVEGRYAIFLFEIPFKQLLIRSKLLRRTHKEHKFMFIEEYVKRIQTAMPFRRRLNKELKTAVNHR